MKRVLLVMMALTLILTACSSNKEEEEYLVKANDLFIEISHVGVKAITHAEQISEFWYDGIYGDSYEDFNEAIQVWRSTDLYKEDMADIEPRGRNATKEVKELAVYPEGYERVFNALNDFNELVRDATNLAVSPSGNYNSYSSSVNGLYEEFYKKAEDLSIELSLKAEELGIELRTIGEESSSSEE